MNTARGSNEFVVEVLQPLAGKTTLATVVYFLSLAVLWAIWRRKDINLKMAFYVGCAFGVLGALGTYPTIFQGFAP